MQILSSELTYQSLNVEELTVSAVLTAALLLNLNFLGAALKREFTSSRIFFLSVYTSLIRERHLRAPRQLIQRTRNL